MTNVLVPLALLEELRSQARDAAPGVFLLPYEEDGPLPDGINDAAGVLRWWGGLRFSEIVAAGPNVRWLHTESAGVDHVLTPAVRAKAGLVVTDSGEAYGIAMSEFVLAWMLMVTRGLPELLADQTARHWEGRRTQAELHGQTVGVIGLGPIGRGVAQRAQAFGMRTLGLRRRPKPVPGVDETLTGADGLARLLTQSDWVVVAAALTDETRTLLGAEQLARMKPTAWLVNVARGAMIDENALIDALRAGTIGGACLDVFAQEPLPPDSPLWTMPNVYIAPHSSSGWTAGLRARQRALFLDNLGRFARGEALLGVVDIARGY